MCRGHRPDVIADHRRAIGGTAPRRIVAAWLIAVSLFGRRRACADFAAIRIDGAGGTTVVV